MRYRLRTLLILLAIGPVVLWCAFLLWQASIRHSGKPGALIVEDYFVNKDSVRYTKRQEFRRNQS